jgi:hypothetical protein
MSTATHCAWHCCQKTRIPKYVLCAEHFHVETVLYKRKVSLFLEYVPLGRQSCND